eukprot:Gb_35212 [translate_table: standard]
MLTEEGKATGKECLQRSGILEGSDPLIQNQLVTNASSSGQILQHQMPSSSNERGEANAIVRESTDIVHQPKTKSSISSRSRPAVSHEIIDKQLKLMGFHEKEIHVASTRATEICGTSDSSLLFDCILKCLPEKQVVNSHVKQNHSLSKEFHVSLPCDLADLGETSSRKNVCIEPTEPIASTLRPCNQPTGLLTSTLRTCTSSDISQNYSKDLDPNIDTVNMNELAAPPLENGDTFAESYDVVLILDDREQFGRDARGVNSRQKVADRLFTQFQINVEIRRLPVGDALWIARHKQKEEEYVLDFIIERKKVDDLCHSINDNRYKDQKLRLMRCGIQRLIYLIEGDANLTDASESIKSASFSTEILHGFDVQRTRDLTDTVRKYGNLTHAITDYYNMVGCMSKDEKSRKCLSFDEFVNKCHELEKETVSDVFGVQLMQVPQVTEDVALAVLDRYPTLRSIAQAYSRLEGNLSAQEQLLKDIPIRNQNKLIGGIISKNIYKFIWDEGN